MQRDSDYVRPRLNDGLLFRILICAKPSAGDQVNDLWRRRFPDDSAPLIATPEVIDAEIKALVCRDHPLHNYRRVVTDLESWVRYVRQEPNTGQLWLDSQGELPRGPELQRLHEQLDFLLETRFLYSRLEGLDDARIFLEREELPDRLVNGRPEWDQVEVPFYVHEPRSAIYRACLAHGAADLWQAYVAYRDNPSDLTWQALCRFHIPWAPEVNHVGGAWHEVQQSLPRPPMRPDPFTLRRLLLAPARPIQGSQKNSEPS